MNDFSLHSNPGDYVSDFGLSGIHLEFPYIRIKCTPKILNMSPIYQIGQSQQTTAWKKCTATYLSRVQGTLPRGSCEPLNSAGASYIKSHPKNLEKLSWYEGQSQPPTMQEHCPVTILAVNYQMKKELKFLPYLNSWILNNWLIQSLSKAVYRENSYYVDVSPFINPHIQPI